MTLPAITRLRKALPKTRFTLLSREKLAGLWAHTAHFDQVLIFDKGESPFVIGKRLKPEDFDTVLILPNSFRTALEAWHAVIPRRNRLCRKLAQPVAHPRHCASPRGHPHAETDAH